MSRSGLELFRTVVRSHIGEHRIVRENPYTAWFSRGEMTLRELRAFTVQFSVFSHLFLEAQLRKCINADSPQAYRAGKEILLNELGVPFTSHGSIEGARFRFTAAHFEWLVEFAGHLGLEFAQLGKRRHGSASTLAFCDVLRDVYGSEDPSVAAGASFAIEHWAAAGFWKQLIRGLRAFKADRLPGLPLGFWTWHDAIEDRHAEHTDEELEAAYSRPGFDEQAFLTGARAVLDAVEGFWLGLRKEDFMTKVA